MYQNTVALPRLDLAGAIKTQDSRGDGIAHLLLPPFKVKARASNMPSVLATNGQVLDIKHAPGTPYARVRPTLGNKTYSCQEAGIEVPMTAVDYDTLGQDGAEQISTEMGKDIVLTGRESAVAAVLTGATGETTFAGQITEPDSAENWGEVGGKPIDDVGKADAALTLRHGVGPRWLVISQYELEDLQKNTQIRDEWRSITGQINPDATNRRLKLDELAKVLGVDRILVGSRRKDTANEGQADVMAYIWPARYALLVRGVINPDDLKEPALGRTFVWEEANVGAEAEVIEEDSELAMTVESYRSEEIKSDVIRVTEHTDQKLLNVSAAQLIKLPVSD